MTAVVPATIVVADALTGAGAAFRLESLAVLAWATAALGAVLVLGRRHPAPPARERELRKAA